MRAMISNDPTQRLAPVLEVQSLSKTFPGVRALDQVSFSVAAGEVHALIGENGAGKSTLLKILSGVYRADSGSVLIGGRPADLSSPKAAHRAGIAMIHQELQQVPELDVAQNMFLGTAPTRFGVITDKAAARERARRALAPLDPGIDVTAKIGTLRVAQRQIIEIAKALLAEPRVIAMDEPTSSLTPREFERLAGVISGLSALGVAVIYVSHKLDEVFKVASRATVLRDGRTVGAVDLASTSETALVTMMVGRELEAHPHRSHSQPEIVLETRGLGRGTAVRNVSLALHRGEVLGIAGLVGAGRTELARLIAGVDRPDAGELHLKGVARRFASPRNAIARGIALLPEERKKDGIVPLRSIASNVALPRLPFLTRLGLVRTNVLRRSVDRLTDKVSLRPRDIDRPIRLFSGGNQQKAILCRWMMADAQILIFDEPTRGIDVGAKGEIYQLIETLAAEGRSIIVVSSELPEILRLADRVLVMRRGVSEGILSRAELSEQAIMNLAVSGQATKPQVAQTHEH
jgi:ribose transport system ATP-binding protein